MFTSETHGIVLEGDRISVTEDRGRTWKPAAKCEARVVIQGLTRTASCELVRLQMLTATVGYAVASSFAAPTTLFLLKTADGGRSWAASGSEMGGQAQDAAFIDERTGYVVANGEQMYRTEDGGQTWTGMAAAPGRRLQFADPEVGWSVLYKKVTFTTDGGGHWNSREYSFPVSANAFSMPRRDRAYVVGDHGMIYRYRVVPDDFSAAGMMAAPLLSGIASPLDVAVQTLAGATQRVAGDAGVQPLSFTADSTGVPDAGATPPPSSGADGFTQDVGAAETQLNTVATELPQFTAKYRSLNLLLAGLTVTAQMPARIAELKQLVQALKRRDAPSATATVQDLQNKVMGLWQMIRMAYQKRGAPAAGTFSQSQ